MVCVRPSTGSQREGQSGLSAKSSSNTDTGGLIKGQCALLTLNALGIEASLGRGLRCSKGAKLAWRSSGRACCVPMSRPPARATSPPRSGAPRRAQGAIAPPRGQGARGQSPARGPPGRGGPGAGPPPRGQSPARGPPRGPGGAGPPPRGTSPARGPPARGTSPARGPPRSFDVEAASGARRGTSPARGPGGPAARYAPEAGAGGGGSYADGGIQAGNASSYIAGAGKGGPAMDLEDAEYLV
jgi:hypothetical protein